MTYIELINRFWKIRRDMAVTAYEADVYFYLLNECNKREWENGFYVATNVICAELCISRKALVDIRKRLKDKGLINYTEGKQGCYKPSYIIITKDKKAKEKPKPNPGPVEAKAGPPKKVTKVKRKRKSKQADELFKPDKPKRRVKKEFEPPNFEEVKKYFEDKGKGDQAELFFNFYESLGWKTVSGAKIEKWDSKANVWILKDNKETKNGTDQNNRNINNDGSSEYKRKLSERAEEFERKFREKHC